MKLLKSNPYLSLFNSYLIDSPSPINISYIWSFGSLLGIILLLQIITGITLAMHYNGEWNLAFISIEHIYSDVFYGWLMKNAHSNGASFFFIFVYIHIFKGMYYGSYKSPSIVLWMSGVVMFFIMMGTAFMGYVLPLGQMSLWGSIVMTNLCSAIPWMGNDIVQFIWGGFSVENPTIVSFYAIHFLLPFMLCALIVLHFMALHENGSNNPLGISSNYDSMSFSPYYAWKDYVGFLLFFMAFAFIIFYFPNIMGHSDNFIPANPLNTPSSIVPEWYFLPFYTLLSAMPSKLGGVIAMLGAMVIWLFVPLFDSSIISGTSFSPLFKLFIWMFAGNFLLLLWLGSQHAVEPFTTIGKFATFYYFAHFVMMLPLITLTENKILQLDH